MKIFYNGDQYTQNEITDVAWSRLTTEGNVLPDVNRWFARGVEYIDVSNQPAWQATGYDYVITRLESDEDTYQYIG